MVVANPVTYLSKIQNSAVPAGLGNPLIAPTDESVGFLLSSLRDFGNAFLTSVLSKPHFLRLFGILPVG